MAGIQSILVIAERLNATAQKTFRLPSFLSEKPPGAMSGRLFRMKGVASPGSERAHFTNDPSVTSKFAHRFTTLNRRQRLIQTMVDVFTDEAN